MGDEAAARKLWEAYFEQLVSLARRRLRGSARRVADEEDVALSALDSFCRCAREGKFPRLDDRNDLWKLLFTITERKLIRRLEHHNRLKRGGGQVRGESVFLRDDGQPGNLADNRACPQPTPDMVAEFSENLSGMLQRLGDQTLQTVALLKLQGSDLEEIAAELNCSSRTVKRKLQLIREIWEESSPPQE